MAVRFTVVPMRRRLWFELHSWIGLKLSLMMFFILATGTLAVFAHDIDWLLNGDMRVTPADATVSWGQQLDAARARYPDWRPYYFFAPFEPWFAAELWEHTPDEAIRRVYIDPYRGEVAGDAGWFNAHRLLRETHRHLMLPVRLGVPLVSAFAVPLLLSAVSSLWIYKRWWRGFFRRPRRELRRSRRFWGDLHRLVGVWSLAFIAVIAATGIWYLVESLGGGAPLPMKPPPGDPDRPPPAVTGASLDRMIAYSRRHYPELKLRAVLLPRRAGQPVALMGQADAWLVRPRANVIAFDPVTGEEVHRHHAGDMSLHQRIGEAADPLHFGTFGGLTTRILWFVFGLGLTALSATGVYLYGLRATGSTRRRKAASAKNTKPVRPEPWRKAWRAMDRWQWLWLALLLLCLALIPQSIMR